MKDNRIIEAAKRCFLRYITSPFAVSLLSLGVAVAVPVFGVYRVHTLPTERLGDLDLAGLTFLFMLGFVGLNLVLVILHIVVAKLLVNHNSTESGLYFRVKDDGTVEAANPQLGKDGDWVSLPPTDQPHEIDLAREGEDVWGVPIKLRVLFSGPFSPSEVYDRIIFGSKHRSFDVWLRDRITSLLVDSVLAQQVLRDPYELPLSEARAVLEEMVDVRGLSAQGFMSNLDSITICVTPPVEVSF